MEKELGGDEMKDNGFVSNKNWIDNKWFNEGRKEGLEQGKQQTLKDVLKIIDKEIIDEKDAIKRKAKRDWSILDELDLLKAQIEKQLGVEK